MAATARVLFAEKTGAAAGAAAGGVAHDAAPSVADGGEAAVAEEQSAGRLAAIAAGPARMLRSRCVLKVVFTALMVAWWATDVILWICGGVYDTLNCPIR